MRRFTSMRSSTGQDDAGPERGLKALGQRERLPAARVRPHDVVRARERNRGDDRRSERAADNPGGVAHSRGEAGLAVCHPASAAIDTVTKAAPRPGPKSSRPTKMIIAERYSGY